MRSADKYISWKFLGWALKAFFLSLRKGEINADIQTENLYLKSSGIVDGEITYRNIIIDSGGLLKSNMVQNISSLNNLIKLNKS